MELIDLSPARIFCLRELRMAPRVECCREKHCRGCDLAAVKPNGEVLMVREVIAAGKEMVQTELKLDMN